MPDAGSILEVKELCTYFPITRGVLKRKIGEVKAVDEISFSVHKQETVALVGESGCGKSTTVRTILRAVNPTRGEIIFESKSGNRIDIAAVRESEMRQVRREIRMVFQDPFRSLNPRMTILDNVGEPLRNYNIGSTSERRDRVAELMDQVGLDANHLGRYPHAFSGGQRQRIGLARALALQPRIILADEPTSALDVSVQAQILNLMQSLQDRQEISYLFITHDLNVVRHFSDRSGVMYLGKIVEMAPTRKIFSKPRHPYTSALLAASPVSHPRQRGKRDRISGDVPDPANRPTGCPFHPRCAFAQNICKVEEPVLNERPSSPDHTVACHFGEELDLKGVQGS
jgi:peptide/nickel transport system ATP-binding protein